MGLVKTRRLAAMHKQQRAKSAMKPPMKGDPRAAHPRQFASAGVRSVGIPAGELQDRWRCSCSPDCVHP